MHQGVKAQYPFRSPSPESVEDAAQPVTKNGACLEERSTWCGKYPYAPAPDRPLGSHILRAGYFSFAVKDLG